MYVSGDVIEVVGEVYEEWLDDLMVTNPLHMLVNLTVMYVYLLQVC